ncbi:hypothetical protein FACS1894192_11440 [Bacilli bacterium]|nr:hypothetical protein FACS1894192_11440 [Bacilli bacterium]GHU46479.1 hypothetical protein FACS1894194_4200 [Bacilli bacterium]
MVDNSYNKYRIENLKRINSRYYLIEMHGRSYIWDFYDLGDFRNYYPFEVFYPPKNSWRLYDVTGKEDEYKSKEQIGRSVPTPVTSTLEALLFFVWLPAIKYLYISLLIFVIMILFAIWSVKKINQIDVKMKPCYILQVARTEKESLWERKVKPIIIGSIFASLFIVGVFATIIMGFPGFIIIFGFFGLLIVFFGTMWTHTYVPNINVKYQII